MPRKNKRKKERKTLPKDNFEELLEPLSAAIENGWEEAWIDPDAEEYKLPDYVVSNLLAKTFLNFRFAKSEGSFGMLRYIATPSEVEIGMTSTTYGGPEGSLTRKLSIPTVGERVSKGSTQSETFKKFKDELLPKARDKGLEVFKWYAKHPEEKIPEIYKEGEEEEISKYFKVGIDPWEYIPYLMKTPEQMYGTWEKKLGPESIKDASVQLNYLNEFGLSKMETEKSRMKAIQKEVRLTLEGMMDVEDVGEVLEAISSAGGVDSLHFTDPYKLDDYRGWDAIEHFGNWVGEKAQVLKRAEKPGDVFEKRKINVLMPGNILTAAISNFLSGRKMWEATKDERKYQLHKLLGQKVMPAEWTMYHDGRQETSWGQDLYGSLEVDAEGTCAKSKKVIDSGRLKRFFNSREYFLPVAEKTALSDELLKEEDPLLGTARKEDAAQQLDTIPTNLYVEPGESDLDSLASKLGKQKKHLYAVSPSLAGVDLERGKIKIRSDLGHPIEGGKINKEVAIGPMSFEVSFETLPDKIKYLGSKKTLRRDAFNLESDGSTYEISATAPYITLFGVEYKRQGYREAELQEFDDLFRSKNLYTDALPEYLTKKRQFLRKRDSMPDAFKNYGVVFQPILPSQIVRRTGKVREPTKFGKERKKLWRNPE